METQFTQRTNYTTRSSLKSRRRGLSLTSQSKCASSQKRRNNSLTTFKQNTFTSHIPGVQNYQIDFFGDQPKFQRITINKRNDQRQSYLSLTSNIVGEKPKIVFRYTNEDPKNQMNNHENIIKKDVFKEKLKPALIQYQKRYLNSFATTGIASNYVNQQLKYQKPINLTVPVLQSYRIIKSVQKRNCNQNCSKPQTILLNSTLNNFKPQSSLPKAYNNKYLIDSRRVDRQIITQENYSNVPSLIASRNLLELKYTDQNDCIRQNINTKNCMLVKQDFWNKSITTSEIRKSDDNLLNQNTNKLISQQLNEEKQNNQKAFYRSPYHLLISTAKKCESKQVSPSKFKDGQKIIGIASNTLENIPEINQFNLKEELPQACHNVLQNQQEIQENKDIPKQIDQQALKIKQFNILKSNKNYKPECLYMPLNKTSNVVSHLISAKKMAQKSFNHSKSPNKKSSKKSKNQVDFVQQIQNKAPKTICSNKNKSSNVSALNSKRNSRRIREIEKRLQQIITICDKNL